MSSVRRALVAQVSIAVLCLGSAACPSLPRLPGGIEVPTPSWQETKEFFTGSQEEAMEKLDDGIFELEGNIADLRAELAACSACADELKKLDDAKRYLDRAKKKLSEARASGGDKKKVDAKLDSAQKALEKAQELVNSIDKSCLKECTEQPEKTQSHSGEDSAQNSFSTSGDSLASINPAEVDVTSRFERSLADIMSSGATLEEMGGMVILSNKIERKGYIAGDGSVVTEVVDTESGSYVSLVVTSDGRGEATIEGSWDLPFSSGSGVSKGATKEACYFISVFRTNMKSLENSQLPECAQ